MSRHSESVKRSIVERYLSGEESYASAGAIDGVDAATVRKWVAAYRAHGDGGLSGKYSHYDAAFKLSVLERMWNEGLSYRQAAALFNIRNAGCLPGWEKRYHTGGIRRSAHAEEDDRCQSRRLRQCLLQPVTRPKAAKNCWLS